MLYQYKYGFNPGEFIEATGESAGRLLKPVIRAIIDIIEVVACTAEEQVPIK